MWHPQVAGHLLLAYSGERRFFGHLSDGSPSVDGGYLGR